MQEEMNLSPADAELERALAGLRPAPVDVDAAELAWRAGHRQARRGLWAWRGLAGALAAGLLLAVMLRPAPQVIERVTVVRAPAAPRHVEYPRPAVAPAGAARAGAESYLVLRERILREGIDALPAPAHRAESPQPIHMHQLRRMLEEGDLL